MKYRGWARDAITVISVALLFFVVTMPFRAFFQVLPVTEVRPPAPSTRCSGCCSGFLEHWAACWATWRRI